LLATKYTILKISQFWHSNFNYVKFREIQGNLQNIRLPLFTSYSPMVIFDIEHGTNSTLGCVTAASV